MAEHIILFVEGDTDEVLFKKIIARYKELANYESNIICHIDNLKGVSKYTSKAKGRLRNYYLKHIRKNKGSLKFVFCSFYLYYFLSRLSLLLFHMLHHNQKDLNLYF